MDGFHKPAVFTAMMGVLVVSSSAQNYQVIGRYKVAGTPVKGTAVDTVSRQLLVATGDGVSVLNADSGATMGTITGLKGAENVLLVPAPVPEAALEDAPPPPPAAATKGFASDANGHVIAFSLADRKTLATIRLETAGVSSLCFDPASKTVEAVSVGGSLTTIDAETNKVLKAGRVTTGSGQIACGTLNHVYVADPAANVVHVLNHATNRNDGDYPIPTGHRPSGVALDTKGRRLFVGCEDGVIEIVDTDSGFTFIELKGGTGPAHATFAWLPQGKGQWKAAAFMTQEDGTLSAIRMNAYINYSLGGQYRLAPGLGAVAYDDTTHHLLIAGADAGVPAVIVVGY